MLLWQPCRNLDKIGIKPASKKIFRNLSYPEIASEEKARNEGVFTANGTFCVDTGKKQLKQEASALFNLRVYTCPVLAR
jgi:ATP-dependent phosphoenolpyruvate carboxykinase